MSVTMKEMNQILRECSRWERRARELRAENKKLQKALETFPEEQLREDIEKDIRANEDSIMQRTGEYALLLGLMERCLTDGEYNVIRLRHIERRQWDSIPPRVNMSRSSCIRTENRGMEKLRRAWERYLEETGGQEKSRD